MNKILRFSLVAILAMAASFGFAQQTVTFVAGTDKGSSTEATKPDEISKEGITISVTAGAFNAAQFRFAKSSTATFTSTVGNITKVEFTCTASGTSKYGPGNFVNPSTGDYDYNGKTGTWTGDAASFTLSAVSAQVRATKIVVTYTPSGAPVQKAEAPTIDGETPFAATTVVTITGAEGTTVYYTTDGSTPNDKGNEYTDPFTLDKTATVKAIAYDAEGHASDVVSKTFKRLTGSLTGQGTAENPYTVTDIVQLNNTGNLPETSVVVTGTVAKLGSFNEEYGEMDYYLTTPNSEDTLYIYNGLYLNGAKFTSDDQIKVGDVATVSGNPIFYNNTVLEYTYGSKILKLVRDGKDVGGDSPVVTDKGTAENPYTPSEVLALTDLPSAEVYIKGVVAKDATGSDQYKNADYYIADNATASQLKVFRGKWLDGANFTSAESLKTGDVVVLRGKLAVYNGANQVAQNSALVSINGLTTAINTVTTADKLATAPRHNMAGQRVGADYKGIVIVNGKKYLQK